jgi:thiol:disulfide interchange protein
MEPNSILPVLVTAVVVIIVVSVGAAIALWWQPRPQARKAIRRTWFALTVLSVLAVVIFWVSTALIGNRSTVDRGLQQKQQNELQQRLQNGGH